MTSANMTQDVYAIVGERRSGPAPKRGPAEPSFGKSTIARRDAPAMLSTPTHVASGLAQRQTARAV